MRWITNLAKDSAEHAKNLLPAGYSLLPPKATEIYSSEELSKMGMTGLYQAGEQGSLVNFWDAVSAYERPFLSIPKRIKPHLTKGQYLF